MKTHTKSLTFVAAAAASLVGFAAIAIATPAEARSKRSAAMPAMASKSAPVVRDRRGGASAVRKLQCIGQYCPKPATDYNAPNTGTYKPLPTPIVRDHRGPNGGGGGVTVTSGPPRRPPHICAGWGC